MIRRKSKTLPQAGERAAPSAPPATRLREERRTVYRPDGPRAPTASSRWIDRWLAACSELTELERSNPMTDAVIDEIDGRMIRIGDQWLADFASCNYLGFDLDREIIAAVPEYLD